MQLKLRFSFLQNFINFFSHKRGIDQGVTDVIIRHRQTLRKLDEYDRGILPKNPDLARYSSVREYLQQL